MRDDDGGTGTGSGERTQLTHVAFNLSNLDGSAVTEAQITKFDDMLQYLSTSPTAENALEHETGKNVVFNTAGDDGVSPDGNTINFDQDSALITREGEVQSPGLGFAHEIGGHIYSQGGMSADVASPDSSYAPNLAEYTATKFETQVANELGEPTRLSYGDVQNARCGGWIRNARQLPDS